MTTGDELKVQALEYGKKFVILANEVAINAATNSEDLSNQHIENLIDKVTNEFIDSILDITKP